MSHPVSSQAVGPSTLQLSRRPFFGSHAIRPNSSGNRNAPTLCPALAFQKVASGCGARSVRTEAKKDTRNLGEQLLDVIEGGPKLRKWYGAAPLDADGEDADYYDYDNEIIDEDDMGEDTRDCVLVTDAESEMGQMLVLQLILARQRVRVLVKNALGMKSGFGPYVEVAEGDTSDAQSLAAAMKGAVKTVLVPGKVGDVADVASQRGIEHIILLSNAEINEDVGGGFLGFGGPSAEEQLWRSKKREAKIARGKVPYTIVRLGRIQNRPGGSQALTFSQANSLKGNISREDAANVCIKAVAVKPDCARVFQVAAGEQAGADTQDIQATLQGLAQEAVKAK